MQNRHNQVEVAFENAADAVGLRSVVRTTIEDYRNQMALVDPTTARHQDRVAVLTSWAALKLGYNNAALWMGGAAVHDIGKIGISKLILYPEIYGKPYDDQSRSTVQTHSEMGYYAMRQSRCGELAVAAGCHHGMQQKPYGIAFETAVADFPGLGLDVRALRRGMQLLHAADAFDAFKTRHDSHFSLPHNNIATLQESLASDNIPDQTIEAVMDAATQTHLYEVEYSIAA